MIFFLEFILSDGNVFSHKVRTVIAGLAMSERHFIKRVDFVNIVVEGLGSAFFLTSVVVPYLYSLSNSFSPHLLRHCTELPMLR